MQFGNPYAGGQARQGRPRSVPPSVVAAAAVAAAVTGSGPAAALDVGGASVVLGSSFPEVGTSTPVFEIAAVPVLDVPTASLGALSFSGPQLPDVTLPTAPVTVASTVASTPAPPLVPEAPPAAPTATTGAPAPTQFPTPGASTPAADPVLPVAPPLDPVGDVTALASPGAALPVATGSPPGGTEEDAPPNVPVRLDNVDQVVPDPTQAALVAALRTPGTGAADGLEELLTSTYEVGTEAERDRAVQDVCDQLRDLCLLTEPVTEEQAEGLYEPVYSDAQLARMPEGMQERATAISDENSRLREEAVADGHNGVLNAELGCFLICYEDGTAAVADTLTIGAPTEIGEETLFTLGGRNTAGATEVWFCHTHPVGVEGCGGEGGQVWDTSGLSLPDMQFTDGDMTSTVRQLGSEAAVGCASISLVEGTTCTYTSDPATGEVDARVMGEVVSSDIVYEQTPVVLYAPDPGTVQEAAGTSSARYDAASLSLQPTEYERRALANTAAGLADFDRRLAGDVGVGPGDVDTSTTTQAGDLEVTEETGEGPGSGGVTIGGVRDTDVAGLDPNDVPAPTDPPVPGGEQVLPPSTGSPDGAGDPPPQADPDPPATGTTVLPTTDPELADAVTGPAGVPGLFPGAPVSENDRLGDTPATPGSEAASFEVTDDLRLALTVPAEDTDPPETVVTLLDLDTATTSSPPGGTDGFAEAAAQLGRLDRGAGEVLGGIVESSATTAGAVVEGVLGFAGEVISNPPPLPLLDTEGGGLGAAGGT